MQFNRPVHKAWTRQGCNFSDKNAVIWFLYTKMVLLIHLVGEEKIRAWRLKKNCFFKVLSSLWWQWIKTGHPLQYTITVHLTLSNINRRKRRDNCIWNYMLLSYTVIHKYIWGQDYDLLIQLLVLALLTNISGR